MFNSMLANSWTVAESDATVLANLSAQFAKQVRPAVLHL